MKKASATDGQWLARRGARTEQRPLSARKLCLLRHAYQPDPISAVLVDPSGSQGWAVGGRGYRTRRRTGHRRCGALPGRWDRARGRQLGAAVGGQRSGDVRNRRQLHSARRPARISRNARIGPDVWLSSALARAGQIAGVRAFLYTGPRVTTGETAGPATIPVPYTRELDRYGQVLASSPIPTYAAASPTDLDGEHGECSFAQVFSGFPSPFGGAPRRRGSRHCRARASRAPPEVRPPTTRLNPAAPAVAYVCWCSTTAATCLRPSRLGSPNNCSKREMPASRRLSSATPTSPRRWPRAMPTPARLPKR